MKRTFAIALMLLAAAACSKDDGAGVAEGGRILFAAKAPETRAFFPGNAGMMYWSSYDNLGVYALNEDGTEILKQDFCAIDPECAGSNEGNFTPRNILNATEWANQNEAKYTFYAYYPQILEPAATYDNGNVLLNVPAVQTGEFGRYQICCSEPVTATGDEVKKNKLVRFQFEPKTALLRLRPVLDPGSNVSYTYIKQVTLTATGDALAGNCSLDLKAGVLKPQTSGSDIRNTITVNMPVPVKVTAEADSNPFIDFVILPAGNLGTITLSAITSDGVRVSMKAKDAPDGGFSPGTRYMLDREILILIDENDPDGSYVDGGDAWDSQVENDGAYTDGGNAW